MKRLLGLATVALAALAAAAAASGAIVASDNASSPQAASIS